MGSDFIASILTKCHRTRAPERFLQGGFLFPKIFKMKPVIPSSPDVAPAETERPWKSLASRRPSAKPLRMKAFVLQT